MRAVLTILAVTLLLVAAACGDGDGTGNGDGGSGSMAFAESCQKTDEKQFSSAPEQIIDPDRTYVATIDTEKGTIVLELDSGRTVTTNNFVFLACKGYYDGLTFHRVEPGFVIQGGDPSGNGTGGPGYTIAGEFEGAVFETGVVGMARTGDPDSAGSQFFIMLGRAENLDNQYAAFGHVTEGQDVAASIAIGDQINTITIEER